MSDNHTGLPHDMPEYVPNWPVPVKVPAKVYKLKGTGRWAWAHDCPRRAGFALGMPAHTLPEAYAAALKHARGCW